jgi:hypothetical protein
MKYSESELRKLASMQGAERSDLLRQLRAGHLDAHGCQKLVSVTISLAETRALQDQAYTAERLFEEVVGLGVSFAPASGSALLQEFSRLPEANISSLTYSLPAIGLELRRLKDERLASAEKRKPGRPKSVKTSTSGKKGSVLDPQMELGIALNSTRQVTAKLDMDQEQSSD